MLPWTCWTSVSADCRGTALPVLRTMLVGHLRQVQWIGVCPASERLYILVSWWLIVNLFTRDKSNTLTCHDNIHNYTPYIHKYMQIYTNMYNFMYIVSTINTTSSSSRWNIAAPNANENTARKSTKLYEIGQFTRILCTVNNKSDNIQFTRASIARIYRVMPICRRVHPIVQDVALIVEGT